MWVSGGWAGCVLAVVVVGVGVGSVEGGDKRTQAKGGTQSKWRVSPDLQEFYSDRCPLGPEDRWLRLHPYFPLFLSGVVSVGTSLAVAGLFCLCLTPLACCPWQRRWLVEWEEYEEKLRARHRRRRSRKTAHALGAQPS